MLASPMKEGQAQRIQVKDVPKCAVSLFLEILYTCSTQNEPGYKTTLQALDIAHRWQAKDEEASAAAGAASYWRGTRVRQEEELNLPAPQIQIDAPRQDGETGENGSMSIEYDGYDLVQECLEYYVDKSLEARNQRRVYEKELHALNQRDSSRLDQHDLRAVMVYLLMENADRSLHKDLGLSLRCLARFFWHYPVVIFHTNGSTQAELAWLKSLAPPHMKVSFEEVALGFPAEILNFPGGPDAFLQPPLCMLDGKHWWTSHRTCSGSLSYLRCPFFDRHQLRGGSKVPLGGSSLRDHRRRPWAAHVCLGLRLREAGLPAVADPSGRRTIGRLA
eukprot:g4342.t1